MILQKGILVFLFLIGFVSCAENKNNTKPNNDTINSGTIKVCVDETLKPLMEAEFTVYSYQNQNASLIISYKPEREVLEDFKMDSARAIIITRELNADEMTYFKNIQYIPRSMPFAKDAIALITNKKSIRDSLSTDELVLIFTGKEKTNTVVAFDNTASSTLRWIKDSLLKNEMPSKNCFAMQNNEEVIKYIEEHPNTIGVIGNNWISNLNDSSVRSTLKKIKRIRIAASGSKEFLEPYQSEIETSRYPMSRMVYCIQRDGKVGLGTGFQRFLYSETGQLIVLKSGLMPFKQPERSVHFKE